MNTLFSDSKRSFEKNVVLQLHDSERRAKSFIESGRYKEDDTEGIEVPFFDLESILAATSFFSNANKLGQGGFGPVYKVKNFVTKTLLRIVF